MSHRYEHRTFMIFDTAELSSVNFNEVLETSASTVRKSVDQTKTFVKWDGNTTPTSVTALTSKEGPYNYEDMLVLMATDVWTSTEII